MYSVSTNVITYKIELLLLMEKIGTYMVLSVLCDHNCHNDCDDY